MNTSATSTVETLTYASAVELGIAQEMRRDERVFFMATSPPPSLLRELGPIRVRRTPISEATLTGMALGAAASGLRPVVWWRNATFAFVAFDQIANQAAKMRYMFGGQCDLPVVFRAVSGGGLRLGAQHSQSPYAVFAHMPGLKVIVPSSPEDAKGLLKSAIRDNDVCISFEPSRLDALEGSVPTGEEELVPLGQGRIRRPGRDITVVAIGYLVHLALQAADRVSAQGVSVEVIDPRTLVPLDFEMIRASVIKTGHLVVADEAPATCSFASEVAALVVGDRETFNALRAPVGRVTAKSVPVPYSPPLEDFVLPSAEAVAKMIMATVQT